MAHSSFPSAACSLLSRGIFRLDNRESAPDRFSPVLSFDLGVPTVFTEGLVTFAGPSFGGIGGLEEDCRRWCDREENEAAIDGVVGRDMDCGDGRERTAPRREEGIIPVSRFRKAPQQARRAVESGGGALLKSVGLKHGLTDAEIRVTSLTSAPRDVLRCCSTGYPPSVSSDSRGT